MTASQRLTAIGLALTLIGALIISWWDLKGGGPTSVGMIERGMPRVGASRVAFPLIALGTTLQIFGTISA
jgi:hypothetical protein